MITRFKRFIKKMKREIVVTGHCQVLEKLKPNVERNNIVFELGLITVKL